MPKDEQFSKLLQAITSHIPNAVLEAVEYIAHRRGVVQQRVYLVPSAEQGRDGLTRALLAQFFRRVAPREVRDRCHGARSSGFQFHEANVALRRRVWGEDTTSRYVPSHSKNSSSINGKQSKGRWTTSGLPGCFFDEIGHGCFHVREGSREAFC